MNKLKKSNMDDVFKKLNFKDQKKVFVINSPESFEINIKSISDNSEIIRNIDDNSEIEFIIAFATKQEELNKIADTVAPKLIGDSIFWICYPKSTSKKYKCDFNRDTGWQIIGKYNMEGVRQIAIDEDWSALRFRKVEFIKTLTRSEKMALSNTAKAKLKEKKNKK